MVWIALGTVVVHLATGWRYGFDRDELMALEDARHLAWGYVQYPPMTAFFGRVALVLFGTSLGGFRLFAALAQAMAVALTGLMAKEIYRAGSGLPSTGTPACAIGVSSAERWVMVVAALAAVPFCLGAGALMQYISFDYVCWVWVAYCVVKVVVEERGQEEPKTHPQTALRSSGQATVGHPVNCHSERSPRSEESLSPHGHFRLGERWWVAVGAGIGLGMLAKYTMVFLACGVVAGLLLTGARRYLRSAWLWLGVAVSLAIFAPNFVWEWKRSFISLDFLRFLHARDVGMGLTDWFLPGQLELTLLAFPLAVAGLWFYFVTEEGERWRILGWMYAVPLLLFLVMRGRDYYLAPAYPTLYAAGAVWVDEKLRGYEVKKQRTHEGQEDRVSRERNGMQETVQVEAVSVARVVEGWSGPTLAETTETLGHPRGERPAGLLRNGEPQAHRQTALRSSRQSACATGARRWLVGVIWVCLILDVVVAGTVALPIAPVASRWWNLASQVDSVFPEEIGWPEFVEGVAHVRDSLSVEEQAHLGILAENYGEVGALNLYGESFGLPRAISGVNSSWERGYGDPAPQVLIVVGYPREFLEQEFASCTLAGRSQNRYGVANEESAEVPEIFVCRGLKESWPAFWVKARTFA